MQCRVLTHDLRRLTGGVRATHLSKRDVSPAFALLGGADFFAIVASVRAKSQSMHRLPIECLAPVTQTPAVFPERARWFSRRIDELCLAAKKPSLLLYVHGHVEANARITPTTLLCPHCLGFFSAQLMNA